MQLCLAEMKKLAAEFPVLPVSKEILADLKTPISVLKTLKSVSSCCYLLESVENSNQWGRYSFLGFDPLTEIKCKDGLLTITNGTSVTIPTDEPNQYIRKILAEYRSPRIAGLPPFTGGLIGYFAYEYSKYNEPTLQFSSTDEIGCNDMDLMLFDKVIAFDHHKQKIFLIVNIKTDDFETNYNKAQLELAHLAELITKETPKRKTAGKLLTPFTAKYTAADYARLIKRAKLHIKEGNIFQVVPSNRQSASFSGSMLNAYRVLRTTNPSPYMFYLSGHDVELIGASPETLVKLDNGNLSTFPIAGTKPRGATEQEDQALEQALLSDPKELSEHDMLVDLGRNDLGRVSAFGSVQVTNYRKIERCAHVMHLTSTVTGKIQADKDALDAIAATLPAGTLSGAPKIRAMEIIDSLEKERRGIYGGAIGYLDFTGNMDVCIAIRFALKKQDTVYVQSGGGIVMDSQPEAEYQETLNKAQAIINALIQAEEVLD